MENDQYYPTPNWLGREMWKRFRTPVVRVLEPSAGDGALIRAAAGRNCLSERTRVDAIEIDPSKHPALKASGRRVAVVGHDFLEFKMGAIYSHIIMNPPFSQGATHVLHAWHILYDGEIVALLNAETVRNPFSAERQLLVRLIEQCGEVDFISGAFKGEDVVRDTDVEVALVYLRKQVDTSTLVGDILAGLGEDGVDGEALGKGYVPPTELALPNRFVENSVQAFKAAVEATRQAALADARAGYYAALLGETMAQTMLDGTSLKANFSVGAVREDLARRYDGLKDRAWANVLRSTQVTAKLSQRAQQRLESEFENIKQLEFTASNIYGFLAGLSGAAWEIQAEMVCDVFDQISRYHSENTVFYMGWKSNDKHRQVGWRIRTTRFIIPGNPYNGWRKSLDRDGEMMLADFDKVFAMLDGKREPENGLVELFRTRFTELMDGARLSSSYFDVRYYPGVGTIHFFARDKGVIDRLNRVVGRLRKWLPPDDSAGAKGFWQQYEKAERFDGEVRKRVVSNHSGSYWGRPNVGALMLSVDDSEKQKANDAFGKAIDDVLKQNGIDLAPSLAAAGSIDAHPLLECAREVA